MGGKRMLQPLFIQWQTYSETGIALLDDQHKGVVAIINTFYHLLGCREHTNILYSRVIDTLKHYSSIHFITEERILEAAGYKDLESHKELHKKLLLEMERIEYIIIRNNEPEMLLEFLKKWWRQHINEQDHLYVQYLHARSRG